MSEARYSDVPPDVIVAGAGPVGLVAALCLATMGVRVMVLEKRETLNTASRASTLHPPTLEILDRLGVLAPVQARGKVAGQIQYRSPEGVFAAFDMADLAGETRFPYRLHLEQSALTPVMLDRLRAHPNVAVLFGAEVLRVDQADGGVAVTVRRRGAERTVAARWLVAADGARSQAREALGLAFDGVAYPHKILRVMTQDDLSPLLPGIAPVTYLFNGDRSLSFLGMADCWRIIVRVPQEVDDAEALDERWMLARVQAVLPGCARLPRVLHKDIYGVSRRVASSFRSGHAYLAGDAAHVTNTRGGMNMNCGIHDADALACALVSELRGDRPGLLDAASDGRRRVATEMLIPRTDRTVAPGPAWTETLRRTARDKDAARAYLRTTSMMDMLDRTTPHV